MSKRRKKTIPSSLELFYYCLHKNTGVKKILLMASPPWIDIDPDLDIYIHSLIDANRITFIIKELFEMDKIPLKKIKFPYFELFSFDGKTEHSILTPTVEELELFLQ